MKTIYSIFIAIGFIMLNIMTIGYFVPSTVAYYRRNECGNVNSIFVLNLFLGWTLVGWVIALIWAMKNKSEKQVIVFNNNSDTYINKIRFTDNQINCLLDASDGKVLYGETSKFMSSQMPNGSRAYNLRTIESLVNRGYLMSNGCGGYIKTEMTDSVIKSSMGF